MKTKKLLCILLMLTLVLGTFVFPAAAVTYPESAHDYLNNTCRRWSYYFGGSAKAILVTFSEDTYTEPFAEQILVQPQNGEITVQNVVNAAQWSKRGDFIAVYDGYGALVGTYDGDELAGVTLFVPGQSFSIILSSDESETAYGFKVTDVKACPDDKMFEITYNPLVDGEDNYSKVYYCEDSAVIEEDVYNRIYIYKDNCVFAGWSLSENGPVKYNGGESIEYPNQDLDLYAVWVEQILSSEDVFWFNNSSYYFVKDEGTKGYYMSEEDAKMLQLNLYKTYGVGPFPTPVLSIVLATLPDWEWQGSCYGISAVTALQYFGKINVLPLQDAQNLGEMELDDNLKSYINYYQANVATSWLCENKALITDGPLYRQCLEDMYNSVANGNLVIFTFYKGNAFVTAGHTVLLTGAYTDANGNHIITSYDCNRPYTFKNGYYETFFTLSPDFSSISYTESDTIGAVNWTDNFDQFEAFDITGKNTDTAKWYQTFFAHISEIFTRILNIFKYMFS